MCVGIINPGRLGRELLDGILRWLREGRRMMVEEFGLLAVAVIAEKRGTSNRRNREGSALDDVISGEPTPTPGRVRGTGNRSLEHPKPDATSRNHLSSRLRPQLLSTGNQERITSDFAALKLYPN